MKLKSLFAFAAIAAMALAGCQKNEEEAGNISISVTPTSLTFEAKDAPSQTVSLTATRKWHVEDIPDWVALDVNSGNGSSSAQTITVSVDDNPGYNHEGEIVFSIGAKKASVQVAQAGSKGKLVPEGDGTLESPYNVLGVRKYVEELGADVESEEEVYVKGIISNIVEPYSFSYGNGTFYITDDGSVNTERQFYAYRIKYIGGEKWTIRNPQIQKGDEVVVLSKVYNYKGDTPETVNRGSKDPKGAYSGKLYSINGSAEPVEVEPDFSSAEHKTVAEFIAAANENEFYVLSGSVSGFSSQYSSFDLTDETGSIYVYSVANAEDWKGKIANRAKVTLAGAYDYYESKQQHEVVSAWIMEVEEAPEQTEFEDKTVAEFIALADSVVAYRLSGKVSAFKLGENKAGKKYMQFDLTDQSGSVLVYGFKDGQYEEWAEKLSNRGTVTLHGVYKKYEKDGVVTPEVVETVIESFEPAPEQTEFEDKTVAEFIALADKEVAYRLHGTVSSLSVNSEQQLMSFLLTDESEQSVKVYGFKAGQFAQWSETLSNGGSVVLHGLYEVYTDKNNVTTHEVMETVIESFEAAPEVVETAEGDGTLENPYNVPGVIAYIDSEGFDASNKVYVAGKISQVDYQYNATVGATFWISSDGGIVSKQFEAFKLPYLGNKAWVEGQKTVKVGDEVVIHGTVQLYHETTYETKSAYLYSLNGATEDDSPLFGVASQAIDVAASATSATINVTGNVAWTAASEATISPASGKGEGAITVSFPENDDTENAKTYTVTVSTEAEVATKSYTITITQAKKPSGDAELVTVSVKIADKAAAWGYKENGDQVVSLDLGQGVVMSVNKDGNNGKFYEGGAEWRLYQANKAVVTIAVPADKNLVSVKFTYGEKNGGVLQDAKGNNVTSGQKVSVTGISAAFSVKNTGTATNGQVKITAVEVVYQ